MQADCVSKYVADRIREIRQKQGLRVVDVSRLSGIPAGSYSCLETGRYKINLDNLLRVLLALGVGIGEVWPQVVLDSKGGLIDESYVEEAVRESRQRVAKPGIEIQDVVEAVAEAYGLQMEAMRGRGSKKITPARVSAALLIRDLPNLRQCDLAHFLKCSEGGISHSIRRYSEKVVASQQMRAVRQRLEEQFGDVFTGASV